MKDRSISEVAREVGLRPSAIRYYEQIGILPAAPRRAGQRRYDDSALHRLVVIQRSRQLGFTLEDIRTLFHGFCDGVPPATRWREVSKRKIEELTRLADEIAALQSFLRAQGTCRCASLDECGTRLLGRLPCTE